MTTATQVQLRRGTSAQVVAFTGAQGEVVVDTTNNRAVVHDGSTAGGFALARRLLEGGRAVVGLDSVNDYYDPALKEARLAVLRQFKHFAFHKIDLAERSSVEAVFRDGDFGPVVHLAAQAGQT